MNGDSKSVYVCVFQNNSMALTQMRLCLNLNEFENRRKSHKIKTDFGSLFKFRFT